MSPVHLSWQKRRGEFNHDWLKNTYAIALGKWLNILEGRVEDPELEAAFVSAVLPTWEARYPEALRLVEDFEHEASPRVLFNVPPLRRCSEETKRWLPDLVHALWLERHRVKELREDANAAAAAAQASYARLTQALAACEDRHRGHALAQYRSLFAEFRDRCQELGEAMEQFPGRILVV